MTAEERHLWDWSRLDPAARRQQWEQLASWVAWFQEHYEPWVKLPTCWPRHEALRSELAFLKGWHEDLMRGGDAYDGVSWHSHLREAAEAWQAVADCKHEEKPWRRGARSGAEATRQHLEIAMRDGSASQSGADSRVTGLSGRPATAKRSFPDRTGRP